VNRILFLKLLEAQLVRYHRSDASYKFLHTDMLPNYDALNKLFKNTADILVYFVELGLTVLKQAGIFSFIISNKFLRATYGEKLRNWLKQYQVRKIIDFGDLPVFEEASTYPMILAIEKRKFTENFPALNAKTLAFDDLQNYMENEGD